MSKDRNPKKINWLDSIYILIYIKKLRKLCQKDRINERSYLKNKSPIIVTYGKIIIDAIMQIFKLNAAEQKLKRNNK